MLTCDVYKSPTLAPHIVSKPMKNNFFVRINSLTSVGIMAARKWSGDNEEGWRSLIEKSILESANECSDFSEDETESEVNSIGCDDESNEEDSE
jgi:hypothetical protein